MFANQSLIVTLEDSKNGANRNATILTGRQSVMWIAVFCRNIEAAKILASKGADCQKSEKKELGMQYFKAMNLIKQDSASDKTRKIDYKVKELNSKIEEAAMRAELFGIKASTPQSVIEAADKKPQVSTPEVDPARAELFGMRGNASTSHGAALYEDLPPPDASNEKIIQEKIKHIRLLSTELQKEQAKNVEKSLLLEEKQKAEGELVAVMRAQQIMAAEQEKEMQELKEQLEAMKAARKRETERLQFLERAFLLITNIKFQKIHAFHPQAVLGTGQEIVFLCKVLVNNETFPVVLKMIPNFAEMGPECHRGSNENELMILHKLGGSHANIIRILSEFVSEPSDQMVQWALQRNLQLSRDSRRVFYTTESHPFTLEDKLKQLGRSVALERIVRYCLDVVECFLFLFNKNIVHGNVKLDNIYVSEDDRIVLGEFGESIETDKLHRCQMKHVRQGNAVFTAPEVLDAMVNARNSKNREAWIDFAGQYSWEVGCLVYCICFGRFPFPGYPRTPNTSKIGAVVFPEAAFAIPEELKALLAGLLKAKKQERMGIEEAYWKMNSVAQKEISKQ